MRFPRYRELTDLCHSVIRLCFLSGSWRGEGLRPCARTDGSSIPNESRVLLEDSHIVGAFADWRWLAFWRLEKLIQNLLQEVSPQNKHGVADQFLAHFSDHTQGKSPFLTCLKSICKIIFARLGIRAAKHKSQICLWFFSIDLRLEFETLSLRSSEVTVYSVKVHRSDAQSYHRALSFGRFNNSMHYSSYSLFPFGIVI
jgi:hypothetical protein